MSAVRAQVLADLRERISSIEGEGAKKAGCLPFGVADIDAILPGGGLANGALHEFAGGGSGTVDGAAAALFAAGIAARTKGPVVWCLNRPDLFFPALAQAGLNMQSYGQVAMAWTQAMQRDPTLVAKFQQMMRG